MAGLPSLPMDAQRQQLIAAVRAAAADGRQLRLRGGGTKDFWGAPLQGEVLDTRDYAGIISYEPSELVVTVRGGTPLVELEAALAEKGQCLAFEPPHFGQGATVGGMVAAGLSGPARASVGTVRDFVLGARMINGKGEDLTFGGQVMKNVAGYDVSRLLAGSWGTLGIITEVSLKVLPVAPAEATLMCAGIGQKDALDLLHRWGGQPLPLNASAWVRDTTAQPVADYLFVRLRGAVAAVQSAVGRMSADAAALGAQVHVMDNAEAAQDWRASGEQTLQFFEPPSGELCLWRLSVPQTAPALDLLYPQYIEWQGAQRWLWAPATAAAQLREAAQGVGGHATLFRASLLGGATDKAVGVSTPLDAVQQRIQRELQKQFDPQGVFATGRMGI
jgi:glycolate oxidase FAD binding subunit